MSCCHSLLPARLCSPCSVSPPVFLVLHPSLIVLPHLSHISLVSTALFPVSLHLPLIPVVSLVRIEARVDPFTQCRFYLFFIHVSPVSRPSCVPDLFLVVFWFVLVTLVFPLLASLLTVFVLHSCNEFCVTTFMGSLQNVWLYWLYIDIYRCQKFLLISVLALALKIMEQKYKYFSAH